METIRLGLIGCGNIAKTAHLPAIAHLSDRVKLVATADVNEESARAAARPWGATSHTDYLALLERKDIDMVVIATPEFLHAAQVKAAAAAGKHILCEKPMASSLSEADSMLGACERANVRLMIGHSRRFTRRYMEVRKAIDCGAIGTVRLVRENERRTRAHMGQAGIRWTPKHWTGDPSVELGVALTHGIHEADLLRWFTRSTPISVYAQHSVTTEGNIGVPDFLTYTVCFTNGAIGSTEISYRPPLGYPAFHQLELYGTEGAIRAKDHDLISITRYRDEGTVFPGSYEILLHNVTAYVRELAEIVDAIREDRAVSMPPSEARAALALALATVESARNGQIVRFRSENPK